MTIKTVFVIGAGLMGGGIAQTAAQAGYNVFLCDLSEEAVNRGKEKIGASLERQVKKNRISEERKAEILEAIHTTCSYGDCAEADLIIEAVYESEAVKKNVLEKVSEYCKPEAIIATNTSSISIAELSKSVKYPSHFLGMHFFSPVPVMKLLEIVKYIRTEQETVDIVKEFGDRKSVV